MYNANKAAVNSYTIILAYQLKHEGIKVNAVTSGFTATKMIRPVPGAEAAVKPVKEGAQWPLCFALLNKDGPTWKFMNSNGEEWEW